MPLLSFVLRRAAGLLAVAAVLLAAPPAQMQAQAQTQTQTQTQTPASTPAARPALLWLGQSAFRLTTVTGKVIVIDPYLTANPTTPEAWRKLEALGHVDLILVTHAHMDHMLDAPALAQLNQAPVWAPAGLALSMQTLGILPVPLANRMNKGGTLLPFGTGGVRITMTHAEHSSELLWRNPETGRNETHVGGEPGGFVIELENGYRIWHLGDTAVFSDMKLIGDAVKPDLLLIPIGGGPVGMNPVDAAYATRELIRPKLAVPMHYGTTPQLTGTPDEYIRALGASPTRVRVMKPGESLEL